MNSTEHAQVVIVEDDLEIRNLLEDYLKTLDYGVIKFPSPVEAIEICDLANFTTRSLKIQFQLLFLTTICQKWMVWPSIGLFKRNFRKFLLY